MQHRFVRLRLVRQREASPCVRPGLPDDVVSETVKANIETLSRGGGCIFAGVHNLPGDMPEPHIRAMMAAYNDCREDPALTWPAWHVENAQ